MSALRFIISSIAIIVSCNASGIGHVVPAVRSFPVVRYAPFYNFPHGIRSIHAVAPAPHIAVAPAPALPAPVLPAPVLPAPPPLFAPAVPRFASGVAALPPTPVITRAFPALPAAPFSSIVRPAFAPASYAHAVPAPAFTPAFAPAPAFAPVPAFAPAPALAPASVFAPAPAPAFLPAPSPIAVARAAPYNVPHLHLYNRFLGPAPLAPAPVLNKIAWK